MRSTTYQITVSPMQKHIRQHHVDCEIFIDYQKAVNHLKLICQDLNIPTPENIDNQMEIDCGGVGYDYRITFETI